MNLKRGETFEGGIKISCIDRNEELKALIESLVCVICLDLVKYPVECTTCESLYCSECWEGIKVTRKKCALGCTTGEIKEANKFVKTRVLEELLIYCEICGKKARYNLYLSHIKYCKMHTRLTQIEELREMMNSKKKRISELSSEMKHFEL